VPGPRPPGPSTPSTPSGPSAPLDPVAPTDRSNPVTPTGRSNPVIPTGRLNPVIPTSPDGPAIPVVPSGPVIPAAPVSPSGSAAPGLARRARHGSGGSSGSGGASGSGRRPTPASRQSKRARLAGLLIVAVGVLVIGLATGFGSEMSAEPTVQAFLLAWQEQHYAAAGSLTSAAPGTAAADLKNAFAQLDATQLFLTMDSITQHGGTAEASFTASVDLAEEGRVWIYHGRFGLSEAGGTWKVQWAPSVVYPGLGQGQRLAVVTQFPDRASVLDAEGHPLQVPSPVYVLGVMPSALTDPAATAARFAAATGLDAGQVLGQITAAPPSHFLKLASLDPTAYWMLRPKLRDVPGLEVQRQRARLFQAEATGLVGAVGNETNSVLRNEGAFYLPGTTVGLSGLELKYQRQLLGTPTTEVVAVTSAGLQVGVLASWPGTAGTPVRTTIRSTVQGAALSALDGVSGSGEIVAVQANTGEVLAVAQRHVSGPAAADALNARLTPGTAFTIVSAAALLGTGVRTGTQISCENSFTVDGQVFTSDAAGTAKSFSDDFADGCGTAFAGLSYRLSPAQFDQVVKGFGIGADWSALPVPAFSGSVPPPAGVADLAAETIGQGNVQMSPLSMAMVAAAVDAGSWHTPQFLEGAQDPSGTALNASDLSELQSLMRNAVRSGAARAASRPGTPVYGQVGLVHTGSTWTSWFVGFRGDIAFTVIESGQTSQLSAAALAGAFLTALGS
jgi:cell division protein FtsI/penicillin-binding protein 2